jgi:hypothetical protein
MDTNGSDERKFLHDIAGTLSTATLLVDMIVEGLLVNPELHQDEATMATQVAQELGKIKDLLVKRRETLIARGVPSSQEKS